MTQTITKVTLKKQVKTFKKKCYNYSQISHLKKIA